MDQGDAALAPGERLRSVSVAKAVAAFLIAGLVVVAIVGVLLTVAQRRTATSEAIREARTLTALVASGVVGPALRDEAFHPGAARDSLDRIVRERVLSPKIVRVKIWDSSGRILYSDDSSLIGVRFGLASDELAALRSGKTAAEVSSLSSPENRDERQFGKLLQVYLGVRTTAGTKVLFETYQPYQVIVESSRRMWLTSLPLLIGGLGLLYVVQAPLAYRMARRLRRSQDEREAMLISSLAASDKERATIAADLHDGVVQGLAGASYSLSAAADRARRSDTEAAQTMADTAGDLRRWVRELRSLVVTITPPSLHAQGLAASLGDLAATLESRGMEVTVDVTGTEDLDETTETLVYRAAQEAVRNIVRHAQARSVTFTVARTPSARGRSGDTLVMEVRDDGKGFDVWERTARRGGSVGLDLLNALVSSHGGTLTVEASPGYGTSLSLRLPLGAGVRTQDPGEQDR